MGFGVVTVARAFGMELSPLSFCKGREGEGRGALLCGVKGWTVPGG